MDGRKFDWIRKQLGVSKVQLVYLSARSVKGEEGEPMDFFLA
jgi:hypothetical protein